MRRLSAALAAAFALALLGAAPAGAAFGVKDVDVVFTKDPEGSYERLAGSHPFAFTTTLGVNTELTPGGEVPQDEVKNLIVSQVEGLVGSQTAVETCSAAQFNTRIEGRPQCPDSSAVGIVAVKAEFEVLPAGLDEYLHVPTYFLEPSPGYAAKLGFVALNVPIVIDVGVKKAPPYNLVAEVNSIPQAILFYGSRFMIWGNPASPQHDTLRGDCVGEPLELTKEPVSLGSCPVQVAEEPFLTLPRACEGPLATLFSADSWQSPGAFTEPIAAITHDEAIPPNPQGMGGCTELGFSPRIESRPTSTQAESPSGLSFSLLVEDEELTSPAGIADSDIEKVEFILPEGMTANPSAAEGLGVCTAAQFAAATIDVQGCPGASRLGSLRVASPLLEEELEGTLYLASPDDNPFGSLLALYMVIRNAPNGILIKLPVEVDPHPKTGQLVSTVEGLPQLPFSRFDLRFREGPRAPLTTPPLCGTYTARAILTPRSGAAPIESTSSFDITTGPGGRPCPAAGVPPFNPGFEAGSINNAAGAFSPFYMRLTRADGQQDMTRFDSILPPGVTGKIAGVPVCPQGAVLAAKAKSGRAELAAPSCPPASRIGRAMTGAGVGPALTYVPGTLYLGGPYHGAPLSVVAIVPAVAGPFDVGTVVVQEALDLNPDTAEVEVNGAASDPIPHILRGIPLKVRDLRVYVDRPGFTLNPTNCEPMATRATLFGSAADLFSPADDMPAPLAARYQAADCASLPFKPKLSLRLKGGTRRSANASLRAELRARGRAELRARGDANIEGAEVILPPSQFIDNAHINNPCTRVQFNAEACPRASILGRARAFTPLLDAPLEGPAYFRSNGGVRKLPDVVADLRGQFRFVLVIAILQSKNARVRTKVLNAPDAPVSKFVLRMAGGKRGLLENSQNLCRRKQRANLNLTGHNGRRYKSRSVVKTSCKAKKRKKAKRHARRR